MASTEDIQIAKEIMISVLANEKTQANILFAPTTQEGHRFEDWWKRVVKAVADARKP